MHVQVHSAQYATTRSGELQVLVEESEDVLPAHVVLAVIARRLQVSVEGVEVVL